MALTRSITEPPFERLAHDYTGIVKEAKAHVGEWLEIIEDHPITRRQAADTAQHIRKYYVDKDLTVRQVGCRVFLMASS